MRQKLIPPDPSKTEKNQFARFDKLVGQVFSVPHSEIQKELDAERERKRTSKVSGHAAKSKG